MDRERLQQVQQSDLSESRVNEDFIVWLKNSGPWYLLAVLVGIAVYLYLINLQRAELQAREQGWFEYQEAGMPSSLEDVAQRHAEIDGLGTLARLKAANTYMLSLQTNLAVGSNIEEGTTLTDEERTENLDNAQRLYEQIVQRDDGQIGTVITTVSALNGLAAIAESRGDVEQAKSYFEKAAARAEPYYPALADVARTRAANADQFSEDIELPLPPAAALPPELSAPTGLESPLDVDNILNLPTPGSETPAADEGSETPAAENP
ncbi:MAG: hypothetical protein MK089_01795 [Phycisphaerales bacterium]|nr:hypothetical protein [Phycisphaerales bacterium]